MPATATPPPTRPLCPHCSRRLVDLGRALCWSCRTTPTVLAQYPSASKNATTAAKGTALPPGKHAVAARLELYAGLLRCPSDLSPGEWERALAVLPARHRRIVILRVLHEMEFAAITERMDEGTGRGMVDQLYRSALRRLAADPRTPQLLGGYAA